MEPPRAGTALWSPRRAPQPVVDAVGAQRLQGALDEAAVGIDACFVVADSDVVLATRNPDAALAPASTTKLLTAMAAMGALGADARFRTVALAPDAPERGTIAQLYLVGGGDPLLVTPEFQAELDTDRLSQGTPGTPLDALAEAIVAAGVRRIPGGVVADDARYESLRYLPTWLDAYRTQGEVGPIGALTVNRGFVTGPGGRAAEDPALLAASELTRLLQARGVSVGAPSHGSVAGATGGAGGTGGTGGTVEVAALETRLTDVLVAVLRYSDNTAAEMLTREIGLAVAGAPTTAAGVQSVLGELDRLGIPHAGVVLYDGSGLTRENRVTCTALAAALARASEGDFAVVVESLAVAGASGTLATSFLGSLLEGHLRAKTGTLTGVTGLVGIVDVRRSLRFVLLGNGAFTNGEARLVRARFAEIAARFPDSPLADELVPGPVDGA